MTTTIIDSPNNSTNKLAAFYAAGVRNIIRYDDRFVSGDWKQVHPAEAKAIADAKMQLGIVYEDAGATYSTFTKGNGYAAAKYSRELAPKRGQPANSAIYFAVDFDASISQIKNGIIPYFRGALEQFAEGGLKLRVGVYGSGQTADYLQGEVDPKILVWITCSHGFAGSRARIDAKKYDLFQNKCDTTLAGADVDLDVAETADWGQFTPWGANPPPVPPPAPPPVISHDTKWLQAILLNEGYYHGVVDGVAGPLTMAAMIAYLEVKGETA